MTAGLPYFKAYDIRGTFPDQINIEVAYRIARAVAEWSGAKEMLLGRDARLSSPALSEAMIDGLVDGGLTVLDLGMVTTPMLNFAVARFSRYGLMITASHNPKEYNGIKVIDPNVEQVYYSRGLEILEGMVLKNLFGQGRGMGKVLMRSILKDYEEYLFERFKDAGPASLSVVIDCSNGVGGLPLGVLEQLGLQHKVLYHIPDGNFPHHGCDTLRPENLDALRQKVKEEKADLGIMFDGDSDRVVFVDEQGEIVPLDLVFLLLARQELERHKGKVFYDLRFSRIVKEEIEKLGGIPVRMRVGNPFHKEALHRSEDGLLAAELSGHIMYREHFGIDDPLYASLKLMSYLARSGNKFSNEINPLRRYFSSGEIRIKTDHPGKLLEKLKSEYGNGTLSELDGITVDYPDWWLNLRPSNTEPIAKLVIEATTANALEIRKRELLLFLQSEGGTVESSGETGIHR
ncbi:MAG: phosphomannomutase/phosphoglucomutase [Nitrospirae bacterium]|nr:phosphomannomutase/phosphoglucomutase [Nitrospirota bacterium]